MSLLIGKHYFKHHVSLIQFLSVSMPQTEENKGDTQLLELFVAVIGLLLNQNILFYEKYVYILKWAHGLWKLMIYK